MTEPRVVVGLDVSYTSTGISTLKNGVYQPELSKTYGTKPAQGTDIERASLVAKTITSHVSMLKGLYGDAYVHLYIEDYAYGRMINREKMGELGGVVKYALYEQGWQWETLPILMVRKIVCGKGNAKKDQVMYSLLKRHNLDITQNDLADATAVALSGDFILQQREAKQDRAEWLADVRDAVNQFIKAHPTPVLD